MKTRKAFLFMLAGIVVLTASACSASSNETTGTSQPTQNSQQNALIEPSQLVSKTEAEGIVGVSLSDAENTEQPVVGLKMSNYESEDRFLQVSLTQAAMMPEGGQSPQEIYQAIVENFADAVKVDGVGDEAYYATPGIHIMKDGYYISVAVGNSDSEETGNMLKQAGLTAVTNLEKILSGQ